MQKEIKSPRKVKKFLEDRGYEVEVDSGYEPGRENGVVLLPGQGRFRYLIMDYKPEFSNFTDPVLFSVSGGGRYYCEKCDRHHRLSSDIGQKHATKSQRLNHLEKEGDKFLLAKLVEDKTQLMLHRLNSFPKPNQPIEEVSTIEEGEKRIGRKEYREADIKQGEIAFTGVQKLPDTAGFLGDVPKDFEDHENHRVRHIADALEEHSPECAEGSIKFFKAKADDYIYLMAKGVVRVKHQEHTNAVLEAGVWKLIPHSFVDDSLRDRRPVD